jgi:hypothetical protein
MTTLVHSERALEVKRLLDLSGTYRDPNSSRSHITGLQHALRVTALLYKRLVKDEAHPDLPFAGLVHDLARPLNDVYHGEIIAEVVRDRVDDLTYSVLKTHGQYQEAIMHGRDPVMIYSPKFHKFAMIFARCEEASFTTDPYCPAITYDHALTMIYNYLD